MSALVLTLTFLVGLFQLALGALRLGTLVNFVSHTVVVGFTAGAAVLIAASQVKNFFGIEIARGSSVWRVLEGSGAAGSARSIPLSPLWRCRRSWPACRSAAGGRARRT